MKDVISHRIVMELTNCSSYRCGSHGKPRMTQLSVCGGASVKPACSQAYSVVVAWALEEKWLVPAYPSPLLVILMHVLMCTSLVRGELWNALWCGDSGDFSVLRALSSQLCQEVRSLGLSKFPRWWWQKPHERHFSVHITKKRCGCPASWGIQETTETTKDCKDCRSETDAEIGANPSHRLQPSNSWSHQPRSGKSDRPCRTKQRAVSSQEPVVKVHKF